MCLVLILKTSVGFRTSFSPVDVSLKSSYFKEVKNWPYLCHYSISLTLEQSHYYISRKVGQVP